jgi:hypothetical protein
MMHLFRREPGEIFQRCGVPSSYHDIQILLNIEKVFDVAVVGF